MNNNEVEQSINNEVDYSNIVPEIDVLSMLVNYCDSCYKQMVNTCATEEEKNKKLKSEYRVYQYRKSYSLEFRVSIRKKDGGFQLIDFKSYEQFMDAAKQGQINLLDKLTIELDLSFRRGREDSMVEHKNSFKIVFEPYHITFSRVSNYNDDIMNQVEMAIREIFKRFKIQNTIFCSK